MKKLCLKYFKVLDLNICKVSVLVIINGLDKGFLFSIINFYF